MVDYSPLWEMMKERGISSTALITKYGVASSTIQRLKKNEMVSVYTIDRLCQILHCAVNDVIIITVDDGKGYLPLEPVAHLGIVPREPVARTGIVLQEPMAELISQKAAQTHQLLRDIYKIPTHCSGYTYFFELVMQIYRNPKIDYSEAVRDVCGYFNKPYYTVTSALRYAMKEIPAQMQKIPNTDQRLTVKTLAYLCVNTLREDSTVIAADEKELGHHESTDNSIETIIVNLLAGQGIVVNEATSHKDFNRLVELISAVYAEPHRLYGEIFAEYSKACNMHRNALHHNLSKLIQNEKPEVSLKGFVTSCVNSLPEKYRHH